jgi:guanylate kinase
MNRASPAESTSVATGNLFVIAAPSGGGKTTIVNALLERDADIRLSVSYTTRAPRPGEQDGVHYHFVDEPRFMALMEEGEFLEHAHVHGNWYATSSVWLQRQVDAGHDVLLEIDWQGAAQVRGLIPSSVHVFILPPSLDVLRQRLEQRGQDAATVIARRVEAARDEMRHCGEFDYVIINHEFATAVADLSAVVRASRLRAAQQRARHECLVASLLAPRT